MKKSIFRKYQMMSLVMMLQLGLFAQVDSLNSPELWLQQQIEKAEKFVDDGFAKEKALTVYTNAIDFAQKNRITKYIIELNISFGVTLYRIGDFKKSYAVLDAIIPLISESDLRKKARVFKIQGMNLVFQDNFTGGYKFQMDAMKYYTSIGDSTGIMNMYYDIGSNFVSQEQFELGLKNQKKGLEIAKKIGNLKMIILGTSSIGGAYASLEEYEKALSYSGESIDLAVALKDNEELAWASIHRGYILCRIKKYKEAEKYLVKAFDLSIEIKSKLLGGYALEQLAELNIQQNRLEKAIAYLDESYAIFNEVGQTYSTKNIVKKYAEIYFKLEDFDKYKFYNDKYIAIKDSLYSKEMLASMADLKQDYEIYQLERENEIALLKKDQELTEAKNTTTIAISIGSALLLILLLTLMYIRNKGEKEKNELLLNKNEEIIRQNEILAASNKDLEKFAYIISHDLKEPLRNINGFTTLLARKLQDSEDKEVLEYADFITNGTTQMEELLLGLLDYSKLNASKCDKEIVRACDIAHKVKDSFRIQSAEKNCKIIIRNLPDIIFRKTQLTQIFQNLIANAIKFGPDKENIIVISAQDNGQEVQFSVMDNGIGIDPQYQKEIFVVFQRLHDRGTYSGSGIGLATCKKIVEEHGGKIWVDSNLGEGSCFHFTVPKSFQSLEQGTTRFSPFEVDSLEPVL